VINSPRASINKRFMAESILEREQQDRFAVDTIGLLKMIVTFDSNLESDKVCPGITG